MELFRQLKRMKAIFLLAIALNVFGCAFFVTVASVYFFSNKNVDAKMQQTLAEANLLLKLQKQVVDPDLDFSKYEQRRFELWKKWEQLGLNDYPFKKGQTNTTKALTALIAVSSQKMNQVAVLNEKRISLLSTALIVGGFSFVFGMLIPLLLVNWTQQSIRSISREIEQTAMDWINDLKDTKAKYFYQDPEFWLQAVLITVKYWGPESNSLALRYAGDISSLVHQRMYDQQQADPPTE